MGFTTPCFIRKNTPEIRERLKNLGYKECIGEEGPFLFTSYNIFDCMHSECGLNDLAYNGLIDCGENEEMFLALAAKRDDTSANQYWVFDKDFLPNYKKGDFTIGYFNRCSCYCHVASVEELIEYFKGKE